MKPYLEAGEFTTTHGIAGQLRLYPWCNEPAFLSAFSTLYLDENGTKALKDVTIKPHKNMCIITLPGITTIEQARAYIGKTAYISRADVNLPSGTYFVQDLLGASVVNADTNQLYGTIAAITHPGRHDVYEVALAGGGSALFPAAEPFMEGIDIENGVVLIRPIEGMFPSQEEA